MAQKKVNKVNEEIETTVESVEEKNVVVEKVAKVEPKKERVFAQNDPILCRSVTAGWLGVSGKSGQLYTFSNYGDECEIEYGDLFALKNRKSDYLYDPLFVIEDEELLENARWKDLGQFYSESIYGKDNVEQIINLSPTGFKNALKQLPKGLLNAVKMEISKRIEEGTFDSLKKINIIDDVCGTDFKHIIPD